jgi:hypothetical protein
MPDRHRKPEKILIGRRALCGARLIQPYYGVIKSSFLGVAEEENVDEVTAAQNRRVSASALSSAGCFSKLTKRFGRRTWTRIETSKEFQT